MLCAGATSVSACKCPAHTFGDGITSCTACPAGATAAPGAPHPHALQPLQPVAGCTCCVVWVGMGVRTAAPAHQPPQLAVAMPAPLVAHSAPAPAGSTVVTACACTATPNSWLDTSGVPTCRVCSNGVGNGRTCVCNSGLFFDTVTRVCQACPPGGFAGASPAGAPGHATTVTRARPPGLRVGSCCRKRQLFLSLPLHPIGIVPRWSHASSGLGNGSRAAHSAPCQDHTCAPN